jgi:hypothetical protein
MTTALTVLLLISFVGACVSAILVWIAAAPLEKTLGAAVRPPAPIRLAVIRNRRMENRRAVLAGEYARSLAAANVASRKLRGMGIAVAGVIIRDGGKNPLLMLKVDAGRSIAPLLDATEGRRYWIPACNGAPARAVAAFDGCTLKWEMPTPSAGEHHHV